MWGLRGGFRGCRVPGNVLQSVSRCLTASASTALVDKGLEFGGNKGLRDQDWQKVGC